VRKTVLMLALRKNRMVAIVKVTLVGTVCACLLDMKSDSDCLD
jgi:hypothetical protein